MLDSEKSKFYALVSDVLGYYGKDASEFALQVWWQACQNFSYEVVAKALNSHATDPDRGQFAPKVADVARILMGTSEDRSAMAWGRVMEALSSVGAYKDVVFDDPAVHAAVHDCGGWVKMCRTDMAELSYLQHRFTKSYSAYAKNGALDYPRVLVGDRSPDSEYAKRGLKPPKPVVIGDIAKARLVYSGGSQAPKHSTLAYEALSIPAPREAA